MDEPSQPFIMDATAAHRDSGAPTTSNEQRLRSMSLSLPWRRPKSSMFTHDDLQDLSRELHDTAIDDTHDTQEHTQQFGSGHGHGSGSIKGILRRASLSIKGMVHRRPSVSAENTIFEHRGSTARPTTAHSTWNRLRQATSFRHSRSVYDMDLTLEPGPMPQRQTHSSQFPIPGFGGEPPVIPGNSGAAAKAAAAIQNEYLARAGLQNQWLNASMSEDSNDGESGIGIAVSVPGLEMDAADDETIRDQDTIISRIDFVSKLPSELAIHVLAYLDAAALTKASEVSRNWRNIVSNQHIWRESCLRETTATYATSGPIQPGTGLGLPPIQPTNDWKQVYRVKKELKQRWKAGKARPVYLNGHSDSIYCLQFDEYEYP